MLRMDRLSQRLLFCLWTSAALPQLACTLVTDVDRSKIPPPAIIEPDPEPEDMDAGAEDPGSGLDAGDSPDTDAAPADPDLDSGSLETGDAQAGDAS